MFLRWCDINILRSTVASDYHPQNSNYMRSLDFYSPLKLSWCRRSHSFSRGPGRVMTFEAQLTRLVTWQQLWKTSLLLFCFRISDSKLKWKLLCICKASGIFFFLLDAAIHIIMKDWMIDNTSDRVNCNGLYIFKGVFIILYNRLGP